MAPSAGAAKYSDFISAQGLNPSSNKFPRYDTKESDVGASVMLELWENAEYPCIAIAPISTQA